VLGGTLEVQYGDALHVLSEGDSAYLDARTARSISCSADGPAKALIITSHHREPLRPEGADAPGRGKLRSALIADFNKANGDAGESNRPNAREAKAS
jgi:glyoxylate utilization-related uncharacterized protein